MSGHLDECAACEQAREDHPYAGCSDFAEPPPDLGTFTLTIETGNAAMQTHEDVADALARASDHVAHGDSDGPIRDVNGNTCGNWQFGGPLTDEERLDGYSPTM